MVETLFLKLKSNVLSLFKRKKRTGYKYNLNFISYQTVFENSVDKMPEKRNVKSTIKKPIYLKRMPGKDSPKQNYPPCNRAFTLRMMNPMSYHEGHTSPLDREIQPLLKRTVAKSHDTRRSLENASICSDISSQDNGLYDIHEHDTHSYRSTTPKMSRDSKSKKTPRKNVPRGNFMVRSHSSADGFESLSNTQFHRNSSSRSTLPVRLRSKSASAKAIDKSNSTKKSDNTINSRDNESMMLKRSRSLNERPKSCNGYIRTTSSHGRNSKSSSTSNVKSSTLANGSVKANDPRLQITSGQSASTKDKKPKRVRSRDDYLDSDSTISEADGYRPTSLTNGRGLNNNIGSGADSSLESSFDSALPSSSFSVSFGASDAASCLMKIKQDNFYKRITDICDLISEKHPGDFQILESLIEMQHAYEERNKLVNEAISSLQRQNFRLQNKVDESVDILRLAKPLMEATKTFENQLQQIMKSKNSSVEKLEQACQAPDPEEKQMSPLEEITSEAIDVANKIEQLILLKSPDTNLEKEPFKTDIAIDKYESNEQELNIDSMTNGDLTNGHLTNGNLPHATVSEC